MKKIILTSLAICVILIILGVWAYLLMYGVPQSSDNTFTNLDVNGEFSEPSNVADDINQDTFTETPQVLRQLTERSVAGAGFTESGIRYVEQGTGHIYEIHLETGKETLLSGTTLPQATQALFSQTAKKLAITTFTSYGTQTLVGEISTSSDQGRFENVGLPQNASEIYFSADELHLNYILKQKDGAVGYQYELKSGKNTQIFSIPLSDVRVVWGTPIHVYTTPTGVQEGHLYAINSKGSLNYTTKGAKGLLAMSYDEGIVTSSKNSDSFNVQSIQSDGTFIDHVHPFIPEKCTLVGANSFYCGVPINIEEGTFPDSWYMGTVSYNDTLWFMNAKTGVSRIVLNPVEEIGKNLDIHKIGINPLGTKVYLINKTDNTLWLYDRSI